jgi:hypothetical protein|tara:strand:+ start:1551 stop:2045 length:495 start_codon:yes stop_codon:yes gene_type:complete
MENLLGLSIAAGFLLSIFIMMIIKNLTRMVYANAKELGELRDQVLSTQHEQETYKITGEDAWEQVLILEDQVLSMRYDITRMDELRIKLSNHRERINVLEDYKVHQENVECSSERITYLENTIKFQADRITDLEDDADDPRIGKDADDTGCSDDEMWQSEMHGY